MRRLPIILTFSLLVTTISAQSQECTGPHFATGSGHYVLEGGPGRRDKCVEIYYHLPQGFSKESPVVLVVPGAGRNGWDYRDAWIDASEKYNVLVLSPSFSEEHYPRFWNYNLGGMIFDVEISGNPRRISDYNISTNPEEWILGDLDRIFNSAKEELGVNVSSYDAFGHSAGGQFLHRMAIFHLEHRAHRILAANSGWYTVPVFDDQFPYGLDGSIATRETLARAFRSPLVVFLGERDDRDETRGDLASSPEIDIQGGGRIERGRYFYHGAAKTAAEIGVELSWEKVVVPNIGHEYRRMSQAAAEYLYAPK